MRRGLVRGKARHMRLSPPQNHPRGRSDRRSPFLPRTEGSRNRSCSLQWRTWKRRRRKKRMRRSQILVWRQPADDRWRRRDRCSLDWRQSCRGGKEFMITLLCNAACRDRSDSFQSHLYGLRLESTARASEHTAGQGTHLMATCPTIQG